MKRFVVNAEAEISPLTDGARHEGVTRQKDQNPNTSNLPCIQCFNANAFCFFTTIAQRLSIWALCCEFLGTGQTVDDLLDMSRRNPTQCLP